MNEFSQIPAEDYFRHEMTLTCNEIPNIGDPSESDTDNVGVDVTDCRNNFVSFDSEID